VKKVDGIWLPSGDNHFARMMRKEPQRSYHGQPVGVYQYFKVAKALELVDQRAVALDIGGHVGFWSMWLAQVFDHVHAFEPTPEHADCFSRNVMDNNVTLHRCAMGATEGMTGLSTDPDNSGKAHLSEGASVPIKTVDSFGFEGVGLIKIDVEGYEPQVLEGARETIARCKPVVVFEDNGQHERYGFRNPHEVAKSLGLSMVCAMGKDWIYRC
jgi:FkbM family methyltransferase